MSTDTDSIYMIDPAGKLFRKGVHIGNLEGETMKLLPDHKKYTAAVTRWLREEADAEEGDQQPPPEAPKLTDAQKDAADMKGMDKESAEQAKKVRAIRQNDLDFAQTKGCPPPPDQNPQYGDKTPAYVEWLHKYRHDEFVTRYGVTGKGKVPIVEANPQTGLEEVVGYREAYFARRKTHLTEKDASRDGLSDGMSWDA